MGAVYEVTDKRSGARVALKTLRSTSPHALYRFKREFRALAEVRHPNLVTLYELVHHDDLWFFTMELVEGVDFLTRVGADRRGAHVLDAAANEDAGAGSGQTLGDEAEWRVGDPGAHSQAGARGRLISPLLPPALRQLCEGLTALHAVGIVHRDIKPSNVMITPEDRVVVLDFGLVTEADVDAQSSAHGLAGTVHYMSPEQAAEQPATATSDWYAVGIMLYQALTGRLPYRGHTLKILADKQRLDPVPPSDVNRDVDLGLNQLCLDLLNRDPSKRPAGPEILERLAAADPADHTPGQGLRSRSHRRSGLVELFVGRHGELEVLREAFSRVLAQASTALIRVSGTSGIDKTALVERFLGELEAGHSLPWILRGRCHERESVPYKAFDALVDALSHQLRRLDRDDLMFVLPAEVRRISALFPVLERVGALEAPRFAISAIPDPSLRRRRAFLTFCELLRNLARFRPVVLFIDDLQWADRDSLALLEVVTSAVELGGMLLIVAYRDDDEERLAALEGAVGHRGDGEGGPRRSTTSTPSSALERSLPMGPLSTEEAAYLTVKLLPASWTERLPRRVTESVVKAAGGNPFFLRELAHLLRIRPDAEREGSGATTPLDLETAIALRLQRLPEAAHFLLSLASVAGEAIPRAMLRAAAGYELHSAKWRKGMSSLHRQGLIRERGMPGSEAVEVYHDTIRERVLAGLSGEVLAARHRQIALAAERVMGDHVDLLARHWAASGDASRALDFVTRAARAASDKLAFERAAELYRVALDLANDPDSELELGRALGDALLGARRSAEAARAYLAAARRAEPEVRGELQRRAAVLLQQSHAGFRSEAEKLMKQVCDEAGLPFPKSEATIAARVALARARLRLKPLDVAVRSEQSVSPSLLRKIDIGWDLATALTTADVFKDLARAALLSATTLQLALQAGEPRRLARSLLQETVFAALQPGYGEARPERSATTQLRCRALSGSRRVKSPLSGLGE